MNSYKTVKTDAVSTYIEKKSEFISYIFRVDNEELALKHINAIRKKHYDATHNVYAYVIKDGVAARFSDDGEPGGTAGLPTMEIIKKEGLSNVLIVTTRYFGGTMLGAGGLIRAYSHSAKLAVAAAGVVEYSLKRVIRFPSSYANEGKIKSLAESMDIYIENVVYGENVLFCVSIPPDIEEEFKGKINEICGESVNFSFLESIYR